MRKAGEKEKQVEARFTAAASMKEELQYYYDSLIMARDKAKASENLLRTKESFYLECWVISKSKDKVQKLLEEKGCWGPVYLSPPRMKRHRCSWRTTAW